MWSHMAAHQKSDMAFSSEKDYIGLPAFQCILERRRRRQWKRRGKRSGWKERSVHQFEEVVKQ